MALDYWPKAGVSAFGLAGHSFGAFTTLGLAGQAFGGYQPLAEPRLRAFIALSPTLATPLPVSAQTRAAYAAVTRPLLCVTGTLDGDVLNTGATPERRAAVFEALPPGKKTLLLLDQADHMSLAGQPGLASTPWLPRQSAALAQEARHHSLISRISSDWWLAHLLQQASAQARLLAPTGLAMQGRWLQG